MPSAPVIGPYELLGELGRGGSSRVFRARHRTSGVIRAVKVLDPDADAEALSRFEREVHVLARAGPAGLVPIHEAGRDVASGRVFYAMDLMPGGSLKQRQAQRGRYPWREAAAIVATLARTLDRCHRLGLVHRDVKPGNVLFDEQGSPRLADFGCARDLVGAALTQSGTSLGTPAYMAPEQLEGKRVDARADVYALAIVLHELVAGTRPYSGTTWDALLHGIQRGERTTLASDGQAPSALDAIVGRALRPRPETRTATAEELARELEALLGSGALVQSDATIAAYPSGVTGRGGRLRWPLLALALTAAVLPAVVLVLYQSRARALAPVITLDEPTREARAREGEAVRVSGQIAGRAQELTVNGARVEPASDGGFATTVTLTPGSPELVVVATGAGGARHELRRILPVVSRGLTPSWWSTLGESARPRLPLPRGLTFGERSGEYVNGRDGSILVFVPGGTFAMGSLHGDASEQPVHDVELSPYFMGKLELTNAQFGAFVAATGFVTTAEFTGSNVFDGERADFVPDRNANWRRPYGSESRAAANEPVVHVTWSEAWAYCQWAGLTLPSEAQWERAAAWDPEQHRASRYPWGEEDPSERSARFGNLADVMLKALSPRFPVFDGYGDGYARLAPVGQFPDGKSPSGCEDMVGNVSEWCLDGYDASFYSHSPRRDPVCPPDGRNVRSGRGASWCAPPARVRVTTRLAVPAWWTSDFRGIRVARAGSDD